MAGSECDREFDVEIVYALPAEQRVLRLRVLRGATVEQAIHQSGLLQRYAEINIATARVGVFGRMVALNTPLKVGDRVEIYRALTVDPKEARRRRARIKNLIKTNS